DRQRIRRRIAEEGSRSSSSRVLTGTVLSGGVQPEGGVRISVREAPTLFDGMGRPLLPEAPFREWTFTSSLGHFEVEAAPGQTIEILAEAIGFAPAITRVLASSQNPMVVLQPAGGISGIVRSSTDGSPIREARIQLRTPYGSRLEFSGDDGEFSFQGLAPGAVFLEVTHPNFQPHTSSLGINPGEGTAVEVLLERGDLLTGQVLAPTESGEQDLSGVLVNVWDLERQSFFGSTVTNATGNFSFASLTSPGRYRLTALAGPLGSGTRTVEWVPSLSGVTLPIQLELPWDLAGRVVDEAGMPISNAALELTTPCELLGTRVRQVKSDGGGHFLISGLGRHCDHQLSIYHPEFAYGQLNSIRADSHGESELMITLPQGVRVLGRVSTAHAPLAAGALVRMRVDPLAHLDRMTLYTYSGEDGAFAFPAIPPGACRLTILTDGHEPHTDEFFVEPQQQEIFRNVVLPMPDTANR
ncbi:MAG TPA: carboxypeptidase-like regulatory domain-containing protein, partial [Planctomycetota bacterium]|nr:carboxypeptidase-like regulatory domain-containing protein [Planctomycetota bacterium]